jgi:phosphomannomutase / phosphoglucomutase
VLKDGTWGVVRASSNKPELVIVAESPTSPDMLSAMLKAISVELARHAEVGQYDD